MQAVRSADGTTIAFDVVGEGAPIITVVGAFNDHATAAPLAQALATSFTVYTYDRRGRGGSGDTPPYAIEREVEDLDALIRHAGGSAALFGYSSGAVLSLDAAARGLGVTRLALYEPPYHADQITRRPPTDMADRLARLVGAGQQDEAVELFQTAVIGIPPEVSRQMRQAPFWPALVAMAPTLAYEVTLTDDHALAGALGEITVPTLVLYGGESSAWLREAGRSVADAMPSAEHRELAGQTHDLKPGALAPVLSAFYGAA